MVQEKVDLPWLLSFFQCCKCCHNLCYKHFVPLIWWYIFELCLQKVNQKYKHLRGRFRPIKIKVKLFLAYIQFVSMSYEICICCSHGHVHILNSLIKWSECFYMTSSSNDKLVSSRPLLYLFCFTRVFSAHSIVSESSLAKSGYCCKSVVEPIVD